MKDEPAARTGHDGQTLDHQGAGARNSAKLQGNDDRLAIYAIIGVAVMGLVGLLVLGLAAWLDWQ